MSEDHSIPIVLEMEGINYWQARPDLWNWGMADKPGYDPENRKNVEWSSWSPEDAVKVGWRNWGSQHRVLPMPNLSSPEYLEACYTELNHLIRSEEHTSELQSLMRLSYAVFCLKKKTRTHRPSKKEIDNTTHASNNH